MTDDARAWVWRVASFATGLGIFIVMILVWGHEGVRVGRMVAAAVLMVGLAALVAVLFLARGRRAASKGATAIARLLRAGRDDEAVRTGRELHGKSPGDPHVAWYFVAALMKSGHIAEARRVFEGLQPDRLPPKMAAMHGEIRAALSTKDRDDRPSGA